MDAKHPMHKTNKEALVGGLIAFALGFMMIWLTPAKAVDLAPMPVTPFEKLYNPDWSRKTCGRVCHIRFSPGGYVDAYLAAAQRIKRQHVMLKIDGECISACTMAADKARPFVCVTPRAVMKFHNGISVVNVPNQPVREFRFDPSQYYSADINTWVSEHGGYPGKDMSEQEMSAFLVMPFEEAKRFYKVCN